MQQQDGSAFFAIAPHRFFRAGSGHGLVAGTRDHIQDQQFAGIGPFPAFEHGPVVLIKTDPFLQFG